MNIWIWTILLTILPVSELRGGIAYAILNGINPLSAFIVCVFFNILIIPIIFFFLDYINSFFLKIKTWNRFFTGFLNRKVKRIEEKYEVLGFFVLFLLVSIPSPGTGAYTGVLLAWFFRLERKKSFFIIALGVIAAGAITTIATIAGKSLFGLF